MQCDRARAKWWRHAYNEDFCTIWDLEGSTVMCAQLSQAVTFICDHVIGRHSANISSRVTRVFLAMCTSTSAFSAWTANQSEKQASLGSTSGKSETKISVRIRQTYGEKEASRAKRFEWYSCFENGRTSQEDGERSGKVVLFVCQ